MKERLTLLQQTKVISPEAGEATQIAVGLIGQHLALAPDNDQFQMAMTHFARAYDRIINHIPVTDGLDQELLNEILADDAYESINALHQAIIHQVGLIDVPAAENSFLLSNLFSLYYAGQETEGVC